MGTDSAVAKLIELVNAGGDVQTSNAAVYALGNARSPAAAAALRGLVDSPDSRIAAAALAGIDTIDEEMLGKLSTIVRTGDPDVVAAALGALSHAGEDALPVLKEACVRRLAPDPVRGGDRARRGRRRQGDRDARRHHEDGRPPGRDDGRVDAREPRRPRRRASS